MAPDRIIRSRSCMFLVIRRMITSMVVTFFLLWDPLTEELGTWRIIGRVNFVSESCCQSWRLFLTGEAVSFHAWCRHRLRTSLRWLHVFTMAWCRNGFARLLLGLCHRSLLTDLNVKLLHLLLKLKELLSILLICLLQYSPFPFHHLYSVKHVLICIT